MTYPPPPGNDPWSRPTPPVDPTLPVSGQPTGTDPYAPSDPYEVAGSETPERTHIDPDAGANPAQAQVGQYVGAGPEQAHVDPYAGMKSEYAAQPYPPQGYPIQGYPGYASPPRTNGMAIAALVLSLVGIGSCITAPVGAILGHVASKQIRETGEGGAGMAQAAIIVGWILTGLMVLGIIFYVVMIVIAVGVSSSSSGY
ncbi:DUF4190 domain-containing protein [Micromonospora sp. DT233]|uniref:DUF4190 domain-containing protein n=1 Tax=Micromonospora sp. DT233 TaxID=3393432 RepID=UPI003CECA23C